MRANIQEFKGSKQDLYLATIGFTYTFKKKFFRTHKQAQQWVRAEFARVGGLH